MGFRIQVLTAAPQPDWEAARQTITEGAGWWGAIKAKVSDKKLRDAFDTTVRGLQQSAKNENMPMLRFAAQIDLDLVDLLEKDFTGNK